MMFFPKGFARAVGSDQGQMVRDCAAKSSRGGQSMNILETKDVSRFQRLKVLSDVNLEVRKGTARHHWS